MLLPREFGSLSEATLYGDGNANDDAATLVDGVKLQITAASGGGGGSGGSGDGGGFGDDGEAEAEDGDGIADELIKVN